jgi:hypothetical protein
MSNGDAGNRDSDPLELVKNNLSDSGSRCLLLIVRGEALLPVIKTDIANSKKHIMIIYGSAFESDAKSEDYNLYVTNQVITSMAKGEIVVFKDINNSIQSSLYDLFNKSYIQSGNNKYCRIAVGANSNPQCKVSSNFNAIVFIEEAMMVRLDLPFLNRFEKRYLKSESILTQKEKHEKNAISSWIDILLVPQQRTALRK